MAIDDKVNSDTTSKNGAFMSGGGAGVSKFHRGWLEVGFTEPIEIMGFEITSTAWENPSNNPNGLLKARIHEKRYQVYQGCLICLLFFHRNLNEFMAGVVPTNYVNLSHLFLDKTLK